MPPMMPFHMHNSFVSGIELLYTLIIVIICFMIYFLTKEIYDLTKHKGIKHFRSAFFFFGLAYISSFLVYLFMFSTWTMDMMGPRRSLWMISLVPLSYFSTLAIMNLAYSTAWKDIDENKFIWLAVTVSFIVSLVVLIMHAPMILFLFQVFLLILILISVFRKRSKKMLQMRIMYLLLAAFWIMNLLAIGSSRFLREDVRLIIQASSIIIFSILLYKVIKWVR